MWHSSQNYKKGGRCETLDTNFIQFYLARISFNISAIFSFKPLIAVKIKKERWYLEWLCNFESIRMCTLNRVHKPLLSI